MRIVRYLTVAVILLSIPFLIVAITQETRYPLPVSGMFTFGGLAGFAANELFLSPGSAGDRVKQQSYRVLLFVCAALLIFGAYHIIAGNTVAAGA